MYAKCQTCGQEMVKMGKSPFKHIVDSEGKVYNRNTEHFGEASGCCNDCNVKHGEVHHLGCDVERCPKCGGQLIGCECFLGGYLSK